MAGQNSGSTALIVRCTDQARGCVKDFHTDTVTVLSSMRCGSRQGAESSGR
jgi:hypothetical protein